LAISSVLKLGSTGDQVREFQKMLIDAGYDLYPYNDNGEFEESTHNATVSWQKERGLPGTGIVNEETVAKIGTSPGQISDPFSEDLEIKFTQAKHYQPANRSDITLIMLHGGETAELLSVHFLVDDLTITQCVKEEDIAYHCLSCNNFSIGIEHAGYARQTEDQWLTSYGVQMLKRSAKLTASLCKKWNIPIKHVNKDNGITTHINMGYKFPIELYINWVQQEYDNLK
jgi:hypothetical protein